MGGPVRAVVVKLHFLAAKKRLLMKFAGITVFMETLPDGAANHAVSIKRRRPALEIINDAIRLPLPWKLANLPMRDQFFA